MYQNSEQNVFNVAAFDTPLRFDAPIQLRPPLLKVLEATAVVEATANPGTDAASGGEGGGGAQHDCLLWRRREIFSSWRQQEEVTPSAPNACVLGVTFCRAPDSKTYM